MFDIVFVGNNQEQYNQLKQRVLVAKKADTVQKAQQTSLTKFVWIVFDDIEVEKDFNFDYVPDDYSQDIAHVFLNDKGKNISNEILETKSKISELKDKFKNLGAFQTRNIPHLGHEKIIEVMLEKCDAVVINLSSLSLDCANFVQHWRLYIEGWCRNT